MARRRLVQIDGKLVPVGDDFVQLPDSPAYFIAGDKNYHGLTVPGTNEDISTRTKHREYMKRTGVALVDDFKGEFAKAAKERAAFFTEGRDPNRVHDVIQAVDQHTRRK